MVQRDKNGRFIPSRNLTGLVGEGSGSSNNNPIENVINDVVSNTENVTTVGNIEETLSPSNIQLISAVFTGIPAFSGVRNSSKIRDFCDAVDATLDLAGVTPRQGLLLAVSRITGAAKSWLIGMQRDFPIGHPQNINSWLKLKTALLEHFDAVHHEINTVEKFLQLRQNNSSILEFNEEFNRLIASMKNFDEFKVYAYTFMLSPRTAELVKTNKANLVSLKDVQQAASFIEALKRLLVLLIFNLFQLFSQVSLHFLE
ncbi:hypothetical protein HMI55_000433 [Coelomomyces lativittatus]|nr:hypothetical protein HMI55_000433 [Coelomomyces lativittatus]